MQRNEFLYFVILSLAAAFALGYRIPGENFDFSLWVETILFSFFTVLLLFLISYLAQMKLASFFVGKISYEFNPIGIMASIISPVLFAGIIPFIYGGLLKYEKSSVGGSKPLQTKIERVALVGIQPLLGLFIASITGNYLITYTAIWFTVWSLIPIPKTNAYNWFDWHPANTLLLLVFVGLIIFLNSLNASMFIPFFAYLIYYFSYIFVLAKRNF